MPAPPRLLPTFTETRSTLQATPNSRIVAGSVECTAAEWPAPLMRSTARAALMPAAALGTRTSPRSGVSFSRASGSSGTTCSNSATSTFVLCGTWTPAFSANQVADLPTTAGSNRSWGKTRSRTSTACSASSR